jgi:hypothetical protein
MIGVGWGTVKAMSYPARIFMARRVTVLLRQSSQTLQSRFLFRNVSLLSATSLQRRLAPGPFRLHVDLHLHAEVIVSVPPVHARQRNGLIGISGHSNAPFVEPGVTGVSRLDT